jgi:hypothetical protein
MIGCDHHNVTLAMSRIKRAKAKFNPMQHDQPVTGLDHIICYLLNSFQTGCSVKGLDDKGGFHKSWTHGIKCRAYPKSGRKCNKLSANALCQIRVNGWHRAQMSSVGRKLLCEIHPWACKIEKEEV